MGEQPPARARASEALDAALRDLPDWRYDAKRRALFSRLVLEDFSEAMGLMVRIGIEAEKADHHPSGAMSTTGSTTG
jgi:4a-hydroxytetrahydrobiopterin dehydratase